MKPNNFLQVTIIDFVKMEGRALKNKARVIGHEGDKFWGRKQGLFTTIGAMADTVFDPTEQYYDFPPPGHFHIERGH